MEPRHFDQTDEDANETPWGPQEQPVAPVAKQDFVKPELREAIARYRLARAALRGHRDPDAPIDPIEPVAPIQPSRRIRDLRL
jgi:hypothetical protein